jgi:transcriptional regulator with XRE-family HTH domain
VTQPPKVGDPVPDDLRAIFARNLKTNRQALGLSQQELSERAGVSRYYIGLIERGTANVTLDLVTTFARVLGLPPGDLLKPGRPRKK